MLDRAITAADALEFATAYKALTDSCKICLQSAEVGVIVIKEPDAAAFPDQDFRPAKRSFLTWKFVSTKTKTVAATIRMPAMTSKPSATSRSVAGVLYAGLTEHRQL